jgi:hypothetical protein
LSPRQQRDKGELKPDRRSTENPHLISFLLLQRENINLFASKFFQRLVNVTANDEVFAESSLDLKLFE